MYKQPLGMRVFLDHIVRQLTTVCNRKGLGVSFSPPDKMFKKNEITKPVSRPTSFPGSSFLLVRSICSRKVVRNINELKHTDARTFKKCNNDLCCFLIIVNRNLLKMLLVSKTEVKPS